MLVNREVILLKVESTYNTDPTPVAADDAILVENVSWAHEGLRMVERPAVRQSIGTLKHLYGGTLMSVTFDAEIKGPGSAYSASVRPEIDQALRACGFSVTVDATPGSETATYTPASTGIESCTIYYYQDGKQYKITGCRGNVNFTFEAGNKGMANFTFTGHTSTPTDVALPTPTYDSTVPPVVLGSSFTVDSYSGVISALTYDMGNEIATPGSVSANDGYGEVRIIKRDVTGSIDPEDVVVATYNFVNEFRTGTSVALASGTIGATQYNKYAIANPAISYRDMTPAERDGVRTFDLPFGCAESSTDDEISIEFS